MSYRVPISPGMEQALRRSTGVELFVSPIRSHTPWVVQSMLEQLLLRPSEKDHLVRYYRREGYGQREIDITIAAQDKVIAAFEQAKALSQP